MGCTGLLGDIVRRTVSQARSIDVVAELDVDALKGGLPDAADLVVWHNADETALWQWLRDLDTTPRVLATVADGRSASLWELMPARMQLGELSPEALIAAICASTARCVDPPDGEEKW
ncbi:hypothetical protein [Mycobacterium sp. C3-094]